MKTSRRQFLKGLAAAPVVATTAELPAREQASTLTFADPAKDGRITGKLRHPQAVVNAIALNTTAIAPGDVVLIDTITFEALK
jgi:hypothetical protein